MRKKKRIHQQKKHLKRKMMIFFFSSLALKKAVSSCQLGMLSTKMLFKYPQDLTLFCIP